MQIDKKQLEINVNMYALRPDFLNLELHYIIASDAQTFRFARWNDEAKEGEEKFYCFLTEQEMYIPAGSITLGQSYVLREEPAYPMITDVNDFVSMIEKVNSKGVGKGIRRFSDDDIETIKQQLCEKYGDCEKHIVKSAEAEHLLFVVHNTDVSISATMVYFRQHASFLEQHVAHVKEQNTTVNSNT